MKLSCPECSHVFDPPEGTKQGDRIACPECNYTATYKGPEVKQTQEMEDEESLTPFEEELQAFNQAMQELKAEDERIQRGGADYGGREKWRGFMRRMGRLNS